MMNHLKLFALCSTGLLLAVIGGCAQADVESTSTSSFLHEPDMMIVNNFAVDPADVKLDRGQMAKTMREDGQRPPNAEEARIGELVSEKLAAALVDELREVGIKAVRTSPDIKPGDTTIVLNGTFLTVDQGNQTERVWIGFGVGGSQLRTRIQAVQAGQVVAQADTSTKSGLTPGMLANPGTAAAASTGFSETVLATVEADARRTAKEVARKLRKGYQDRGWLN
jgi:Domain of unknown function (DUF4410)